MKYAVVLATIMLVMPLLTSAQSNDKFELNGYITNMQYVSISEMPDIIPEEFKDLLEDDNNLYNTNINFQNRLNMYWYANDKWTFSAQMRNRLIIGDQIRLDFNQQIEKSYENNGNYFNPAWNVAVGNSYILNLAFDRLYADYSSGNLDVTVGKQRINWGKTFAFNPNDMFNTYSYFDFDYEERPGTDAVRMMYYTGASTSVEFAANIDSAAQVTAALKWNINVNNYDVQLIGGMLQESDLALGIGWSGYVKNASWRGELSWYQPFENFADTTGVVMLSTGLDFNIGSKWNLQTEMMFAHLSEDKKVSMLNAYSSPSSVKDLAISPFQILGSGMFQASPLSTFSLACIWYPHQDIKGIFVSPSWSYSISDNFNASFYWQLFNGKFPNEITQEVKQQTVNSGFVRFKYSF